VSSSRRAAQLPRRLWLLVRHDVGRKLTALAFALVLWGILEHLVIKDRELVLEVRVVSTSDEANRQRAISVDPAVYLVVPDDLLVRDRPRSLKLHVKGLKDDVEAFNMSALFSFDASMLGGDDERSFEQPLERESFKPPRGDPNPTLTDFRVSPDALAITLARRMEIETTLTSQNVTTEGRPREGYYFQESRITVRPPQVRLSGPAAVIATLRDDPKLPRLSPVQLGNRISAVIQHVGLPQDLVDKGVKLETPSGMVEVTVPLVPEDVTRELLAVPVEYLNEDALKARGWRKQSADPALDLKITGPPSEIGNLSSEDLARRIWLRYDWSEATLDRARPKVHVGREGLSLDVKVRMLGNEDEEPFIEYSLEVLRESP
jgi:hypothetical protein